MKTQNNLNVKANYTLLNWIDSVENFIKVSAAQIILNRSRDLDEFIRKNKNLEDKRIINTRLLKDKFHLNEFLNDEDLIEKINKTINILETDEDEYAGLKPNSTINYTTSSSKISSSSGNKKEHFNSQKMISMNLFFKRRNVRFVVEKWNFIINYNDKVTDKTIIRRNFIYKKLMNLTRTLSTVLRILPMYTLTKSNLFEFDFEITNGDNENINKNSLYNSKNVSTQKFNKMEFTNYSDNIGSIKIHIYYMNKNTILIYEDEMKKNIFEDLSLRHRFDSESHIQRKDSIINLKRANSKSVDNSVGFGINYVQINDYMSIEDKKINSEELLAVPNICKIQEEKNITFSDFISTDKICENIKEKYNELFLLKFKINKLQQLHYTENELINKEESKSLSDSEFSLVSKSDMEILDITNEDFSDFELKELSIHESFEEMNKSVIETVSYNCEQDSHKFFITYTKIKKLILNQKQLKFDLVSLVKSNLIQKP
jgi:hypothetical protein